MTHPWPDLKWWNSGERQVVEEKIDDLVSSKCVVNPEKRRLYAALRAVPEREVRVAILGQDPYPTAGHATGTAFEVADTVDPSEWPPTWKLILREYCSDLHYDMPSNGKLRRWTEQGVLLWNAIPCCKAGAPLSCDWGEWEYLTGEIVERLSKKGIVFVFLGGVAGRYQDLVKGDGNRVIRTSHPSPRGNQFGKTPFTGSRVFSTINAKLRELSLEPIDWELKDELPVSSDVSGPKLGSGRVLSNATGAVLPGLKRQGTSPNIHPSLDRPYF